MQRRTRINLALMLAAFTVGLGFAIFFLREPTEPLTMRGLEEARERWRLAGIDAYTLRYRMHGSDYDVTVRDGIVTVLKVNGKVPLSGQYRPFGVTGMFDTLEEEIDNLSDPRGPFAGRSAAVVMRVRFHPENGVVERYIRSSGGHGRGTSIELVEFFAE